MHVMGGQGEREGGRGMDGEREGGREGEEGGREGGTEGGTEFLRGVDERDERWR